jgi:hypothetical protein
MLNLLFINTVESYHVVRDITNIYEVLIILLSFIAISYFYGQDLKDMLMAFFTDRVLNKQIRENTLFNSSSLPFLFLLICFIWAYNFKVVFYNNNSVCDFTDFLFLVFYILLFFILKVFLLIIISVIYSLKQIVNDYILILYISVGAFSILLLPLVVSFILLLSAINLQLFLFKIWLPLVFIYAYIRSSLFFLSNFRFYKLYFILYLCTLEICPLVILYKLLYM